MLGANEFMSKMRAVGNTSSNAVAYLIVGILGKNPKFNYAINHLDEFKKT